MSIVTEPLIYHFGEFTLDVANRELRRGTDRLDLNARYFDALVLLVREAGQLVAKERFFTEVWDDVVVSDSALTQGIRAIRRVLGDDAAHPRFIQTVPRHGYRFIAPVTHDAPSPRVLPSAAPASPPAAPAPAGAVPTLSGALATTLAATLGGTLAGVVGGLFYGLALAHGAPAASLGTASVLLVMISLAGILGTMGGFGIGAGIAAAEAVVPRSRVGRTVGAMLGGLLVGGTVKLLGVDAFNLLFGRTPAGITGGLEGAALGLAVGLAAYLGGGFEARVWWRPLLAAAVTGTVAGALIALAGGHLLGGSLDLLARSFEASRLQLDALGRFFGEVRLGPTTRVVLAACEGLLFTACLTGALGAVRRPPTGT
ncbi:MAG: hypothetical protein KatS3mg042_1397 [Rhodothermaceae bacterium]|nr:MAG: hypothetical protein KatS3mg042_1397 [Rhodothermaceae bacterium]